MILVGELSLWVALLMATWTTIVSYAGGVTGRAELVTSGERGIYATFVLVVVASGALWTALVTHDFSIRYVASFTTANLPTAYTITALWAGRAGSLLFWALILAGYSAGAVHANRDRTRALMPYVTGTLAAVMVFFLAILALGANPFERLDWIPPDGRGMNPQLQSPGMAVHPPSLYLGYLGTTVPFAFAVAALVTRRLSAEWLGAVRRWALIAWFFTTVGILSGMWWAYVEPGWSGYWAWDAVKNASLLPWLVNTAFLLSITVQEKRGTLRKWNVVLVVSAFLFSIFGTFITRSGSISSVQSLGQSPAGMWFAGFLLLAIALTGVLVRKRLRDVEAPIELESVPGREDAHVRRPGDQPFALVRRTARNRRRYGGYIVYLGVVILFAAFAGLAFRMHHDVTLRTGEVVELRDPYGGEWRFASEGISRYDVLNRQVTAVTLTAYRDGGRVGLLTSEMRQHVDSRGAPTFEPTTKAGIIGSPRQDVYGVLAGVTGENTVELRIGFNPLVWWVWFGGCIVALGGLIAMWPRGERRWATIGDALPRSANAGAHRADQ